MEQVGKTLPRKMNDEIRCLHFLLVEMKLPLAPLLHRVFPRLWKIGVTHLPPQTLLLRHHQTLARAAKVPRQPLQSLVDTARLEAWRPFPVTTQDTRRSGQVKEWLLVGQICADRQLVAMLRSPWAVSLQTSVPHLFPLPCLHLWL